jgi:hypothetical protein
MSKSKVRAVSALLLAGALTFGIFQNRNLQRLRAENSRLRELAAAANAQSTPNSPPNDQAAAGELERLRLEHTELLRSRGEITRLRQQLTDLARARPPAGAPTTPPKEPDPPPEPVQNFVANADATVPAGQALLFGGWPTPPGKRTLVFIEPKVIEASGAGQASSVELQGKFFEVPDEILAALGLDKLQADSKATSVQRLLAAEEMKSILRTLEESPGVTLMSAPRIQTGDGRQARISVTQQKIIAGQEHTLGPSLEIDPRIATDGSSINLSVSAHLTKLTAPE